MADVEITQDWEDKIDNIVEGSEESEDKGNEQVEDKQEDETNQDEGKEDQKEEDQVEDQEDNNDDGNEEQEVEEEQEEDSFSEYKELAESMGLSDEDIKKTPKHILATLRKYQETPPEDKTEGTQKEKVADPPKKDRDDILSKLDLTAVREKLGDEVVDGLISPIINQLQVTREELDRVTGEVSSAEEVRELDVVLSRVKSTQSYLDEVSNKLPEFGKSEKLPIGKDGNLDSRNPAVQKRSEIWDVADVFFSSGKADTWDKALEHAMQWYKGSGAEGSVKRDVIGKLNKQKQQFTARGSGKKRTKTKLSKADEAEQFIGSVLKKAGVAQ